MKEKKMKERKYFYMHMHIRVIITKKSETKVQSASERDPEHLCRINKQGVGEEGGGNLKQE